MPAKVESRFFLGFKDIRQAACMKDTKVWPRTPVLGWCLCRETLYPAICRQRQDYWVIITSRYPVACLHLSAFFSHTSTGMLCVTPDSRFFFLSFLFRLVFFFFYTGMKFPRQLKSREGEREVLEDKSRGLTPRLWMRELGRCMGRHEKTQHVFCSLTSLQAGFSQVFFFSRNCWALSWLWASFFKGQEHQGHFSLVKCTLWRTFFISTGAFQGQQGNE